MSNEVLGLISIAALSLVIFTGFPIAFILLFMGIVFGYLGFGNMVFDLLTLQFFSTMRDITLAAVPLFVFMGLVLEKSNLVERLFKLFMIIMGRMRGSLYLAVCITAVILAAATGIVGASVTLLGVMAGPLMKKYKYDVKLSAGTITAGGTLGILIPPSVMLVVMGPVMGVSVTQLFAAAIFPGILLASLFALYSLIRCYLNPELGPPLPEDERKIPREELLRELLFGVLPPVLVILAALGSILFGLATPTDAAALGATCSLVLAFLSRRFGMNELKESVLQTVKISTMIMFLLACSNFFGAVFSRLGTAEMISEALLNLNLPSAVMLMLILAIVFLLGWPLEWVPIVVIYLPIMLPVVQQYGWDLLWFCTLVAVCMQTAWLSPPVALSAYFLKGVVPEWELKDIYLGMMQFMVLQLIALILVAVFPGIATWLPSLVK
ncbi:C4-dicarboxylate TRAP transporter large permease protein DctM [Moorella humiferrea]|uniref:TRAP transporter large permease n=1 Tax=Neomoorella humiferrea TaxID=676965 RepID=UPI0030D54AD5